MTKSPVTTELPAELAAQLAADTARAKSVVGRSYKAAYAVRAASARGKAGVSKKVVAQSNGDWLALELAAICRPNPKQPLDVDAFVEILDCNGVKHDHYSRTSRFWQGRLRMSAGLALRTVVADAGELQLPDGNALPAPKSWIARWAK